MRTFRTALLGSVAAAFIAAPAFAENLTIGVSIETPSIDPHFFSYKPSHQIAKTIFDPIVKQDINQQLIPGLAESWRLVDDNTWEFKLRKGVVWHDGTPFTADDILFTAERSEAGIPGSPTTPTRFFLLGGKKYKKIDDFTVHVVTPEPYAPMAADLSLPVVVGRKNGTGAGGKPLDPKDYDAGKATVGTGPYKFVEFLRGDRVVLKPNPNYWSGKPEWDQVTYKSLSSGPTRVAALLSGAVDLINDAPPEDIPRLKADPKIAVHIAPSNNVIRFQMDQSRTLSPHVFDNDGKPLFPSPILDQRVRHAMSLAIDRERISQRIMNGTAIPAGQFVPPGSHGHDPNLIPDPYDPEGAKRLLAAAGYPDGFKLTIHGTSDRYVNDGQIMEAVAQMFTRVGIKTTLEIVPSAVSSKRARAGEFSFFLSAWGSGTGDGANALIHGIHSYMPGKRLGAANWGRYNNMTYDKLAEETMTIMDAADREAKVREAYAVAMKDYANIMLHWEANSWASRADLTIELRKDQFVLAHAIHKVK